MKCQYVLCMCFSFSHCFISRVKRSVVIELVAFRLHILRTHIQSSACYHRIVLNGKDFQRKLCKIIYGLQLVCKIHQAWNLQSIPGCVQFLLTFFSPLCSQYSWLFQLTLKNVLTILSSSSEIPCCGYSCIPVVSIVTLVTILPVNSNYYWL